MACGLSLVGLELLGELVLTLDLRGDAGIQGGYLVVQAADLYRQGDQWDQGNNNGYAAQHQRSSGKILHSIGDNSRLSPPVSGAK